MRWWYSPFDSSGIMTMPGSNSIQSGFQSFTGEVLLQSAGGFASGRYLGHRRTEPCPAPADICSAATAIAGVIVDELIKVGEDQPQFADAVHLGDRRFAAE